MPHDAVTVRLPAGYEARIAAVARRVWRSPENWIQVTIRAALEAAPLTDIPLSDVGDEVPPIDPPFDPLEDHVENDLPYPPPEDDPPE